MYVELNVLKDKSHYIYHIKSHNHEVKNSKEAVHPIQTSEKNYHLNREMASMEQLRKMQGLHAPLKIQMEKKLVSRAGHLPCITNRTNLSADILNGVDDTLGFEDFLGQPENFEGMTSPHDVIEASMAPTTVKKASPF